MMIMSISSFADDAFCGVIVSLSLGILQLPRYRQHFCISFDFDLLVEKRGGYLFLIVDDKVLVQSSC